MYECHIIVPSDYRQEGERVARMRGWKTSKTACDNELRAVLEKLGDDTSFCLTENDENLITLHGRMCLCKKQLQDEGIPILRCKIEMIVYDTKTGVGV